MGDRSDGWLVQYTLEGHNALHPYEMLHFVQPLIYSLSFRCLLCGGDALNEEEVEICSV